MSALHQVKSKEENETENQPSTLHGRAMDNLEFIRDTMQSSTEFTAVPGYGGVWMGVTAILAAVIANMQPTKELWFFMWIIEAFVAVSVGFLLMWIKSKNVETSLTSRPAKKFALGFSPSIIAAIILTSLFVFKGFIDFLPSVWLTLYGTAVVSGGAYSVRVVRIKGWIFIVLGAVSVFVPAIYGNWLMGLGFGILNVIFGLIIAKKHGG